LTPRVLLTGGSGFIGRHAVRPLQDRGFEVHLLGRRTVGGAAFHYADLKDAAQTAAVVREVGATHLLHLAWGLPSGRFWSSPENLDWVAASLALYRAFAATGGQRVVVAGTCAEYDWSTGQLDASSTALAPATLYGLAKHSLHSLLAAAAKEEGVSLAWGRLFFVYGPAEAPARLVPSVIRALLREEPAILGDCLGQRDFMHAADTAGALVTLLSSGFEGAADIASGDCRPMRDIVQMVADRIGRADLLRFGAHTAANDPPQLATRATALRDLGFRPAHTLNTGLDDTIAWWRGHQDAGSSDE
jgi:nucleoside-diphosphate-sugar epimerase